MLLTSATGVSRWRTPPSAGRVAVDAGEQQRPVRRVEVGGRSRRDLRLDVDQRRIERPVGLADEVGVEAEHHRIAAAGPLETDPREMRLRLRHRSSSYSIQVERSAPVES